MPLSSPSRGLGRRSNCRLPSPQKPAPRARGQPEEVTMWRARIAGISVGSEGGAAAAPLWRMIAFRLLALLAGAFFVLAAVPQALSPWLGGTLGNMTGVHDVNVHRWSTALAGWPDLGGAAVLFYAAWRPASAALPLPWLALAAAVFLASS